MSEKLRITRAFGGCRALHPGKPNIRGYSGSGDRPLLRGPARQPMPFLWLFSSPNTFRRLLAEGSLTVSFIPVFSHTMIAKGREAALRLANNAFTALTLILITLVVAGVVFAPSLITIMVPGFAKDPGKIELTAFLARLMFPYLFFVSLMALCMGILNSLRHFFRSCHGPYFS